MGVTDSMVSTPLTTTTDVIMFINVSQREDMEVTVIINADTHLLTELQQQQCDNKNIDYNLKRLPTLRKNDSNK